VVYGHIANFSEAIAEAGGSAGRKPQKSRVQMKARRLSEEKKK